MKSLSRQHGENTHSQQFNVWGAEMLLLSDMSRITPSVLNKLCNPPPLPLPLCLQSLSARIVLELSRELLVVSAAM